MNFSYQVQKKVNSLSKLVLAMTSNAGSGHPSSSLSLIHIITVLMYKIMYYDPSNPWNQASDRLILSEGHAVPIVYAAYADLHGVYGTSEENKKVLTINDLNSLRQINSPLDGHPNPSTGFAFFDCATGSLGQGLSCACGLALASRLKKIKRNFFVIIGDGESREGQIWEACDFLIDHSLKEIIPLFNCNGLGQTGPVSNQQSPQRLANKLSAYGFEVHTIDGHDPDMIRKCLRYSVRSDKPNAIIALTIKGWGVQDLQNASSHGKPLKKIQLEKAFDDLDLQTNNSTANMPAEPIVLFPTKRIQTTTEQFSKGKLENPDFSHLLENDSYLNTFLKGTISTRRAFGLALREAGKINNKIVALDADVNNSTYSEYFKKAFPDRFFECRIAEQNMISTAAGLAKSGIIPFVSSFAKFLVRGYDQLELALISNANIKLCGSHTGANIAADGPSQMGLTDVAYMRCLSTVKNSYGTPAMVVLNPSCAVAAFKLVQLMIDHVGLCYLRTIRQDLPILYEPSEDFQLYGAKRICQGSDIAIMASGYMVHRCKKLINELLDTGVSASLYDCYCIPLNPYIVSEAAEKHNGRIISVEDNFGNSLGSEIASIIASDPSINAKLKQIYVSRIPKSGLTIEDVLDFIDMGV